MHNNAHKPHTKTHQEGIVQVQDITSLFITIWTQQLSHIKCNNRLTNSVQENI